MKKILLTLIIFSFISYLLQAQVYQLPNGGFELWDGDGTNDEPSHWNGFPSAKCDLSGLASMGCGTATATRHARSNDVRPGSEGNYSCKIFATKITILGNQIIANGTLSTGQIRVGSATASSAENYNITRSADPNHNQPFNARPDSIRFWAKFECPNGEQEARMNAVIHDYYDYRDPQGSDPSAAYHVVGRASLNFNRADQDWKQYSIPFNYDFPSNTPAYLLLTFTTNKDAGVGSANDFLFVDDIEMVYNTNLKDLTVNGNRIPDFKPGITEYSLDVECGSSNVINAYAASPNATVTVSQLRNTRSTTLITVTAGNEIKEYTVHLNYRNFTYITDEICQGEPYTRNGFDLPAQENDGIFSYILPISSTENCEDALKLTLTVNPTYTSLPTSNLMICENTSYNFFGTIITTPGIYTATTQTVNGCDSVVTINLSVGDRFESTITASICEGEVYNRHGFSQSTTGIYSIRYNSVTSDCDSIVFLDLTVNPSYYTEYFDTIFKGTYYNKYDFNIVDTDTIGDISYYQNFETDYGCDSIIKLNLHIKEYKNEVPPTSSNFHFEIYPNPAISYFKIYIEDYEADDLKYYLYNSYGSLMSKGNIIGNYFEVDVNQLRHGTYIIKIALSEEYYKTAKIVIN